MIDFTKVDFVFKTKIDFVIPVNRHDMDDDCSWQEASSVSTTDGDIMFLSIDPDDKDLLVLNYIESKGITTIYNYKSSLSIDFLKLNSTKENNNFIEMPLKLFLRNKKIDDIVA